MQGRRCALCGSTRFRLHAAQLVCSAGHIQRDFRIEAAHDDDGFGTQVTTRARHVNRASQREAAHVERRRRRLHARRLARGRTALVVPGSSEHAALEDRETAYLYGPRATFAIVQALQLVLRQQIAALRTLYNVDVETYAREIWALHVSGAAVPPAPYEAACDAADRTAPPTPQPMHRTGRQRYADDAPRTHLETVSLRSTIAVAYLALVLHRVPITLGDLRRHIVERTVPYLSAIRFLPSALLDVLSYSDLSYAGLDSELVPSVTELHRRVGDIATRLQLDFGVVWPEVNAAPVLSRMVRAMLLPASVYVGAKSLLSFLRIDMHLRNVSAQLPHAHSPGRAPSVLSYSRNATVPRCVMLMAAVVVVLKLRWGLDGMHRRDTVASGMPPLHAWLTALRAAVGLAPDAHDTPPAPFAPWDTTTDLLGLSDEQVDTYLDFLEHEYTLPHIPASMRHLRRDNVEDLLAFGAAPAAKPVDVAGIRHAQRMRLETLRAALYNAPCEPPAALAAGEAYPLYAHDPSGALPRDYVQVLACANRVLGLDTEPAPSFQAYDTRRTRDQDILPITVMQLDEALVVTLLRKRNQKT